MFTPAISGAGSVNVLAGTTALTGANTDSGTTNVDVGTLRAGALNTLSPNSPLTVASRGTVDLSGFNQTVPSVSNGGLITMGTGSAPGTSLTTTNYTGTGGTIGVNSFLGSDGSPSDTLVINGGTATGNSLLRVTNVGGPGAETMANGIAVVAATDGGTTGLDTLALAGKARGGAFDYFLYRGGLNGSRPDDWFLRSTFIVGPLVIEPPPSPNLPLHPPPEPLPPGIYPIIGPEIATYSVVQPIARQMGLTTLGTSHDCIGDTLLDGPVNTPCTPAADKRDGTTSDCPYAGWGPSAWGRVFGQQVGNRHAVGVYFAYANSSVDVDGLVTNAAATDFVLRNTGHLNLNGWSGGAYWTHYGPGGWYLDAVAQVTRYDGSASTQFARLDTSGTGFVGSLEGGYPTPLPAFGSGFVLEPPAQIVWQHASFNDANDGLGGVDLGTTSGVSGRIGLRGKGTFVDDGN